jgi:hypothetical protein
MDREERNNRYYKTTKLGTIRTDVFDSLVVTSLGNAPPRARRTWRDFLCGRRHVLPSQPGDVKPVTQAEVLFRLYDQTCQTWRGLIDVRFKLLAFVPAASVLGMAAIFANEGTPQGLTPIQRQIVAAVGAIVTMGLLLYDIRNSQLHDDLISRGRKIEDELGVDTGIFRGRLKSSGMIKHGAATGLIYGASVFAWLVIIARSFILDL